MGGVVWCGVWCSPPPEGCGVCVVGWGVPFPLPPQRRPSRRNEAFALCGCVCCPPPSHPSLFLSLSHGAKGGQEEPGGSQEERGGDEGARRSQKEPVGAEGGQEGPGESQEEPGGEGGS